MKLVTLLLILTSSCKPAQTPTAVNAAAAAIEIVDAALAVEIENTPTDAGISPQWETRVQVLERASYAVKHAQDVCPLIPDIQLVALSIGCTKCLAPILTAKEQLQCQ